jgi:flagellar basal-body rod modification protein FlgD
MATTSAITSTSTVSETTGKSTQALTGDDFMQIMITELTNQDPFEPMKNQDLLNQMSTIQQMQSNQSMASSFESLMTNFNSLLSQDSMSTATKLIGQIVTGTTAAGQLTLGKVVAVSKDGDNIMLELDTGQKINWNDITRLGGNSTQDLVGDMAIGKNSAGNYVVGKIDSVEMDAEQVLLNLKVNSDSGQESILTVPLSESSIITEDTADVLIGRSIESYVDGQTLQGTVKSVEWAGDEVYLNVADSDGESTRVLLSSLTKII